MRGIQAKAWDRRTRLPRDSGDKVQLWGDIQGSLLDRPVASPVRRTESSTLTTRLCGWRTRQDTDAGPGVAEAAQALRAREARRDRVLVEPRTSTSFDPAGQNR